MDSNSDSGSSVHSTDAPAFRSSSTILAFPNPNDPQYERGPLGEQFIVVDHIADLIPGVKISGIWHYGGERRRTDGGSFDRYWRYSHYKRWKERPDSTNRSKGSEVYDSEVDSFNSRVNSKAIGNGNDLTATAERVQYGGQNNTFLQFAPTPCSAGPLPNREIYPAS
jgi:hypothetical protein